MHGICKIKRNADSKKKKVENIKKCLIIQLLQLPFKRKYCRPMFSALHNLYGLDPFMPIIFAQTSNLA